MQCESYLLDSQALALLSHTDSDANLSKIVTLHGTYVSSKPPLQLLSLACLHSHSSIEKRTQEAVEILKFKQKPPFLLAKGVGVFPTSSSRHNTCAWIFNHFFTTTSVDKNTTMLSFSPDIHITVAASLHIIRQQNARLHLLLSHSTQLKKELYIEQFLLSPDRMKGF